MIKPLKEASKQYFENQQLSVNQLSDLEQLMQQATTNNQVSATQGSKRWLNRTLVSSAAMVMLAILVALLYPSAKGDLSLTIAKEVAKNHIKLKPLEITSDDFARVSGYFTELDFSPAPSDHFAQLGMDMLGGRYCSIQSVTAAQLRYQDDQGKLVTLYEVGYDPSKFGDIPILENKMLHLK